MVAWMPRRLSTLEALRCMSFMDIRLHRFIKEADCLTIGTIDDRHSEMNGLWPYL